MLNADLLPNETERIAALQSYHILDTVTEPDFDDLTELAAVACGTPVSLISLVDVNRLWYKSHRGLPLSESERKHSFCSYAIEHSVEMLVVEDAREDERFKDHPLITGNPELVFYAGVPLVNDEGYALGSLCIIDKKKRTLTGEQAGTLKILAGRVMEKLEVRRKKRNAEEADGRYAEAERAAMQTTIGYASINQQLKEKEQLLQLVVKAADFGLWQVDLKTNVLTLSDRTKEMHGVAPGGELSFGQAYELIDEAYREQIMEALARTREKDAPYNIEYIMHPADGSAPRWVWLTGVMAYDEEGRQNCVIGTIADITGRKKDEQRKGDFISMVSHEMKAPLAVMSSYLGLMDMELTEGSPDISGMLSECAGQINKMRALINGFLNKTQAQTGKIVLQKQSFSMSSLTKQLVGEAVLLNPSIHFDYTSCENVMVNADKDKIASVISNFLSNAVKYSPNYTSIRIGCNLVNNLFVNVRVRDEGKGIAPEEQEKLFDRFYRVQDKDTQTVNGFGIGLYLCAEIIKAHCGEIGVESIEKAGSTFWFSLPLA